MVRFHFVAFIIVALQTHLAFGQENEKMIVHDNLMDHGNGHLMDMGGGMVMGQNTDQLPGGCDRISESREVTVRAGHKFSEKFPGTMFAFDQQEWKFKPCAKVTIHFINEDNIRHQFMVHGLPKYLYKSGMFHLEATGPSKISGTLIFPGYDQTYLVHCDIAQHMEKGMKGQIVIGKGGIAMPSVPGLNPQIITDSYSNEELITRAPPPPPPVVAGLDTSSSSLDTSSSGTGGTLLTGMLVIGLVFGVLGAVYLEKRFKGKRAEEVLDELGKMAQAGLAWLIETVTWLVKTISSAVKKAST